jgi:hypothetical protein
MVKISAGRLGAEEQAAKNISWQQMTRQKSVDFSICLFSILPCLI